MLFCVLMGDTIRVQQGQNTELQNLTEYKNGNKWVQMEVLQK